LLIACPMAIAPESDSKQSTNKMQRIPKIPIFSCLSLSPTVWIGSIIPQAIWSDKIPVHTSI